MDCCMTTSLLLCVILFLGRVAAAKAWPKPKCSSPRNYCRTAKMILRAEAPSFLELLPLSRSWLLPPPDTVVTVLHLCLASHIIRHVSHRHQQCLSKGETRMKSTCLPRVLFHSPRPAVTAISWGQATYFWRHVRTREPPRQRKQLARSD